MKQEEKKAIYIRISAPTKKFLIGQKIIPRETYDSVIVRLCGVAMDKA